MQFPSAQILVFAKAPIVGQVKTRLIPALGAQQACDLYQVCLDYTVRQRCTAEIAPVTLCVTPSIEHQKFKQYAKDYGVLLQQQQGHDLGARMAYACRVALAQSDAVLLTGADAPALSNAMLEQALQQLYAKQPTDIVMAPAEDGGYVLLGLRQYVAALFEDMPWGTAQVARLTRERCQAMQLTMHELTMCWDLDQPEDVERLVAGGLETDSAGIVNAIKALFS
jgi:rSAM/selenodomain-associated transferase 1